MAVRLVVAVTDSDWFDYLRARPYLTELNFWSPGATPFKALSEGELFLFKLHAPRNFIVGGGVFFRADTLPCSLAWEAFGEANGAASLTQMRARVAKYRRAGASDRSDFSIGCRILDSTVLLARGTIEFLFPADWAANIVSFKGYSTDDAEGRRLWEAVHGSLESAAPFAGAAEESRHWGEPTLIRPRLGQGAFRILVTDSYRAHAR